MNTSDLRIGQAACYCPMTFQMFTQLQLFFSEGEEMQTSNTTKIVLQLDQTHHTY